MDVILEIAKIVPVIIVLVVIVTVNKKNIIARKHDVAIC